MLAGAEDAVKVYVLKQLLRSTRDLPVLSPALDSFRPEEDKFYDDLSDSQAPSQVPWGRYGGATANEPLLFITCVGGRAAHSLQRGSC